MRRMSFGLTVVGMIAVATVAWAAPLTDGQWMNLWQGKAPEAKGTADEDTPAFQVVLPPAGKATGAAMIVCPGGCYAFHAGGEGKPIADWFASQGVTAFVLRYRLGPKYHHPVELGDAQRAIRLVRSHAAEWKLDPKQIGIIGFSAGGHLASTAATHFDKGDPKATDRVDRVSSRPDLQILVYPVITMGPGGHGESRFHLLGGFPNEKLVEELSNEKHVTRQTPPAFLVHSTADTLVPVGNSDEYAKSLKAAGVPYEYVRGEMGGHGFGLQGWTAQCAAWLTTQGFVKPAAK